MTVAIIDYGSGNLRSAAKAFERMAGELALSETITVTSDAAEVRRADRIVLPGVGAFADCKRGLEKVPDMIDVLAETVQSGATPFLGICVGMQLMAEWGLEHGNHQGLGWIDGEVRAIEPADLGLKVPHMGWNELQLLQPHPVFADLPANAHAYFVHSFHMETRDPAKVIARADYGGPITAAIAKDNMVGTQFHPEKSQAVGLKVIANFLTWSP